jgi:hypothetical protein
MASVACVEHARSHLAQRSFPKADVASGIRKLPERALKVPAGASPVPAANAALPSPGAPLPTRAAAPPSPPQPARSVVEPLSAARYRIQLNASVALKDKLEHLANLLSHSIPSRDLAEVIERALDLAIARAENRRFGKTQAHKLLQAEQDFGTEFIVQRRIPSRPSRSSSVVPPRRARATTCTRR